MRPHFFDHPNMGLDLERAQTSETILCLLDQLCIRKKEEEKNRLLKTTAIG